MPLAAPRVADGAGGALAVVAAAAHGGAGVDGAAAAGAAPPRGPPAGPWIYWTPTALHAVGDPIVLDAHAAQRGNLALTDDPSAPGTTVVARQVGAMESAAGIAETRRAELCPPDLRVATIRYGADGKRFRGFRESVDTMSTEPFDDFPLSGPRTCGWLLESIAHSSLTPVSRHSRWTSESGVAAGDRSRYEHEIISRAIEVATTYDCLNLPNLACFELLARRLQLLEESHLEDPLHPTFEGARHFLGTGERRGGALIAPSLQAYVGEQLGKEAVVAKERRKAREAHGLTRKSGKGDPKGGGRGDQDKKSEGKGEGKKGGAAAPAGG